MKICTNYIKLWLFLLFFTVGCGSAPKVFNPPPLQKLNIKKFSGLRQRVVVKDITSLQGAQPLIQEMGLIGIEESLTQYAMHSLVQSKYVDVLERVSLNLLKDTLNQEADAEYFDQKTTAKKGKFLGANLLLIGSIDQIEPNISQAQASIKIPYLGSLKGKVDRSAVQVSLRLVNAETSKVIVSAIGRGEVIATGLDLEVNKLPTQKNGEFKLGMTTKTPLGHCFMVAINQAIERIANELHKTPWECKIASAKEDKVFASCGRDLNVRKGLKFTLLHRGEAIQDEAGALLGYEEEEDGSVTIVSVQNKLSVGKHIGQTAPKKGDVLRFQPKVDEE
jgi:curli biogenesis system outer membrane secretion channel CsgG